MLFGGYAVAQALSFVRNAIIGHALSKGDFGIAAAITLLLQLVETLTDLGSDRLIVQAIDGNRLKTLYASHTILIARGLIVCGVMLLIGPLIAGYFAVPNAALAFQLAGVSALIRGFIHLDWRRAQRRLDNGPHLAVEIVPQAAAVTATLPMLALDNSYSAVVWLSLFQAFAAVAVSHVLARPRYRLAFDAGLLSRQIAFGWPILASALPLIAVYQADRIVIARAMGMESLAEYSAAFMLTMVPGLIAAKVGHALMLPLFSDSLRSRGTQRRPFALMVEAMVVLTGLYIAIFLIAGGGALPIVFGPNFIGLGPLVSWLAIMWALRMIQAVPGMALMAAGITRPFLTAGVIRAAGLLVVLAVAAVKPDLIAIAAVGVVFEALSLAYIARRAEALEPGLGTLVLCRVTFLLPVALAAVVVTGAPVAGIPGLLLATSLAAFFVATTGLAVMPALRALVRGWLGRTASLVQA